MQVQKRNPHGGNGRSQDQASHHATLSSSDRPTVVVLGMGFGGLWAARTLSRGKINVEVVDRHNYHTFFPLLYQVGAAELEPEDIAYPFRRIFWSRPNLKTHVDQVQAVDFDRRIVKLRGHEIHYDYLVIGLGSQPNTYGIPGVSEHAFTLKSLDQGVILRNHILACFEHASCEPEPELRRRGLTFTIVGGGPTGVEFAGALMELIRGSIRKDYPGLNSDRIYITLLEASDHLLEAMPRNLGKYAQKRLGEMGVEVRISAQVTEVTSDTISLKDGTRIPSGTVIWTAGVNGNSASKTWGVPVNRHDQVKVLPTLQLPDRPEVYVIGDQAAIEQDGHPLPMVAQVGIQSGTAAAKNILAQIEHQPLQAFHYHDKGTLAVIGRNAAAAYIWGRSFTGFPAWLLYQGVHLFNLIGFRNRLLVLINWAWAYFFSEHTVRLIVPSESTTQEPATEEKNTVHA